MGPAQVVNYYPHHIGDYLRDTLHLSLIEHGAYRRLLDYYYASEKPLPLETQWVCKLIRADSELERETVAWVLTHFFEKREDGWHNPRADDEIKAGNTRAKVARRNGKKGGRPKTRRVISGLAKRNPSDNPDESSQNQNQNQKPKPKEEITTTAPDASRRPPKVNGHRISFDFGNGAFSGISEQDELRWQEAFPAVPIPPAIVQAASWLRANPANRKSNYERFLVNWFKRDQDKAGRVRK